MSEINETPTEEVADIFATSAKDISHVTFYFDRTPQDYEDSAYYFFKVETPGSVNDDLDTWYQEAIAAVSLINPEVADYRFLGAAIKSGSHKQGGEIYYAADGSDSAPDESALGLIQSRDVRSFFEEYDYNRLM